MSCGATDAGPLWCMVRIYHTPHQLRELALKPWQVRAMRVLESTPAQVLTRRSSRLQSLIQEIAALKDDKARLTS
eukprot:5891027-Amphidinium_carterae.2